MSLTLLPALGTPFPPTGLPHPALLGRSVPSVIVTCNALFGWYPWNVCSFQKGNRGMDLWERGGGEDLGGVEDGKLQSECNL